jgi:hypothetical protein
MLRPALNLSVNGPSRQAVAVLRLGVWPSANNRATRRWASPLLVKFPPDAICFEQARGNHGAESTRGVLPCRNGKYAHGMFHKASWSYTNGSIPNDLSNPYQDWRDSLSAGLHRTVLCHSDSL